METIEEIRGRGQAIKMTMECAVDMALEGIAALDRYLFVTVARHTICRDALTKEQPHR